MVTKVEKVLDEEGELGNEPQLAAEYVKFLSLISPQRIPTPFYKQALINRLSKLSALKLSGQDKDLNFQLIVFGVERVWEIRKTQRQGQNIYVIYFVNSLNQLDAMQVDLPPKPLPVQLQFHTQNLLAGSCNYIIHDFPNDWHFGRRPTQLVAEIPGAKAGTYKLSRVDLLHVPVLINFVLFNLYIRNLSLSKRPFEPLAIARQLQPVSSGF